MSPAESPPWTDDERVAVALLAGLPAMTLSRLRSLVVGRSPLDALAALDGIAGGRDTDGPVRRALERDPSLGRRWARAVSDGLGPVRRALSGHGVRVIGRGDPEWPDVFEFDPAPPSALFLTGSLERVSRRVAIVGTRRPTATGRQLAARFGRELADAGVSVVSGLALGVDGAAHQGALSSPDGAAPIAVVANGHDQPYPRRHAHLWSEVARRGAVVSEWPPGTPPDAFRFPLRNRVIAAMSELVVVVESRESGGSLITAREAADRGVDVVAVPGAPGSPASRGTNRLVQDGAGLVVEPAEVLAALRLSHAHAGTPLHDPRPTPTPAERAVLALLADGPATIDSIAAATASGVGSVAMHLARLERTGWVFESDGWFEALDEWSLLVDPSHEGRFGP